MTRLHRVLARAFSTGLVEVNATAAYLESSSATHIIMSWDDLRRILVTSCEGAYASFQERNGLVKWAFLVIAVAFTLFIGSLMAKRSSGRFSEPLRKTSGKQTFGDQMAKEGEIGNIWKSTATLYSFLAAYGALAAIVTGCSLTTIPLYYVIGMDAFYAWHYAAHLWEGPMHDVHMRHHKNDFADDDFYGDASGALARAFKAPPTTLLRLMDPRSSMTASIVHEGPLAAAMLLIIVGGRVLAHTSILALAFVLAGYLLMALIGSALHISFHVRNFELEPFSWYRELRALHYVHHLQHKNFAMVNIHADYVFGSFDAFAPSPPPRGFESPLIRSATV